MHILRKVIKLTSDLLKSEMIIWWQNTAVSIEFHFFLLFPSIVLKTNGNKTINEQESLFESESEQDS